MPTYSNDDNEQVCIEPMHGATYSKPGRFAVYGYGTYPETSVLAGQTRRSFIDDFASLEEAKAAYPEATVSQSSGYRPPYLNHLSDSEDY